jgi:hypothetical protein
MKRGLYVVVRADLPMGLQMAQLGHAAYEFGRSHPNLDVGENIYVLSAPNEEALLKLVQLAVGLCPITIFHEPDVGGQLTAAAFGGGASKLLRKLPPAGRAQTHDPDCRNGGHCKGCGRCRLRRDDSTSCEACW